MATRLFSTYFCLFILAVNMSFTTILAGGPSEEDTPLLGTHKTRAVATTSRAYTYFEEEKRLVIEQAALREDVLEGISLSEVKEVQLQKTNKIEALSIKSLDFLTVHFPSLRSLNGSGFAISTAAAASLGGLSYLTKLTLEECSLDSQSLGCMKSLSCLTELYLRGNQIGDDGAEVLANFLKLRILDISWTRMTPEGLKKLDGLPCIEKLNIAYNLIGSPEPASSKVTMRVEETTSASTSFVQATVISSSSHARPSLLAPLARLQTLTHLILFGGTYNGRSFLNFITPEDLSVIHKLVRLESLHIGANRGKYNLGYAGYIKSLAHHPAPLSGKPVFLESLGHLTELIAMDSGIEDQGLEYVGKVHSLKKLDLSTTGKCNVSTDSRELRRNDYLKGYPDIKLKGAGLHYLLPLKNLTELTLDHQGLGHNAKILGNFVSLVRLSLVDTLLSGDDIVLFANLSRLEFLNLSYNAIGSGTQHISSLSELKTLYLDSCNIGDEAFSHLVGLNNLEMLRWAGPAYCELTPDSIPNIILLAQNTKLTKLCISPVYFSKKEQQKDSAGQRRELASYRLQRNQGMIEHAKIQLQCIERKGVWEKKDVSALLKEIPPHFSIAGLTQAPTTSERSCCYLM